MSLRKTKTRAFTFVSCSQGVLTQKLLIPATLQFIFLILYIINMPTITHTLLHDVVWQWADPIYY